MAKTFSYKKAEKLKSRKLLEQLFANGKSFLVFPIKVFYLPVTDGATVSLVQAGVGTSSRNFKHAADRNRIKRLIREAYRLNKLPLHDFLTNQQKQVAVFFLYIDKALPQENIVQQKMPLVLEKLMKQLS
ncbi:MAG: ribonuclease P protein component [Chitinophagaceae bacterium]|jgi:ribonuclease P protein component|nr:ribonuclease P protein component [Chitinophagaceae bacterium]